MSSPSPFTCINPFTNPAQFPLAEPDHTVADLYEPEFDIEGKLVISQAEPCTESLRDDRVFDFLASALPDQFQQGDGYIKIHRYETSSSWVKHHTSSTSRATFAIIDRSKHFNVQATVTGVTSMEYEEEWLKISYTGTRHLISLEAGGGQLGKEMYKAIIGNAYVVEPGVYKFPPYFLECGNRQGHVTFYIEIERFDGMTCTELTGSIKCRMVDVTKIEIDSDHNVLVHSTSEPVIL